MHSEEMKADAPAAESGADEGDPREEPAPANPGFTVKDRRFWTLDDKDLASEETRPKLPTYVEQLQEQLQHKDGQLKEYIAAYKKEVVEGLEKTKARLERDAAARLAQLQGQLAEPLMEVLDSLERCLAAAEISTDFQALLQGVKMVHLLMVQQLQTLGLDRIDTAGQPFDPSLHEAVAVVPVSDPAQDNIIQVEVRPGFRQGERLVRAAQVQVGRVAS